MGKKSVGILIGVAAVVAVLGGTGYYFRDDIKQMIPIFDDGSSEDKVYVEKVSRIMNQYAGVSNRYNGVVETQDSYEVNVDSSRTISEIKVEVGDEVEEGQTLVTYDTSDLTMKIEQAKLELEGIQNEIDNYNKQIDTLTKEMEKVDESERYDYTTQIQNIQNSIAQKQFDMESKKLEISKEQKQVSSSSVVSKVAGVVKEINEKGVDSNGNSAPFMTILQTGEYRIKGSIDEQNVWMLSEGQEVVIRSRVDSTETWSGTIGKIDTESPQQGNDNGYYSTSSSGDTQSASKYPFYVDLDSVDGLILGQHVYIELDQGQEEVKEGLWLYGSYIVQDEDTPYVWTANEKNRLEKRYIELGEYDADMDEYEIVSGLTEDDYITWPMAGLYEGVTTVTDEAEVDYSAPLYNQSVDEEMYDTEGIYDTELLYDVLDSVYDTELPDEMYDSMDAGEGTEAEVAE
ncbi:efflux RND transporter periplasmic adaptor subunit [Roseburia hominis]|uniref:efflux RND transporter periplasmic adaptor subunit n=1 Tax=Roseburia hominis TaxID=301301 RepID=UPI0026EFB9B6|nr:efflux RND transporter periplasmic adaptor subunit [Roseburia hominis]MCI7523601.1 efflux RND transporter periplasmic adaptor subunit [Roseburia hominis]